MKRLTEELKISESENVPTLLSDEQLKELNGGAVSIGPFEGSPTMTLEAKRPQGLRVSDLKSRPRPMLDPSNIASRKAKVFANRAAEPKSAAVIRHGSGLMD